ncbi:hypothetical protein EII18_02755 [Comamonadaceae bacterium OH3737_COT-264]|nr:hypothetical protein EII18_02755 [Comamonadaceae bacterium OH3737_COT-264]
MLPGHALRVAGFFVSDYQVTLDFPQPFLREENFMPLNFPSRRLRSRHSARHLRRNGMALLLGASLGVGSALAGELVSTSTPRAPLRTGGVSKSLMVQQSLGPALDYTQKLYLAFYQRPGDIGGMLYWSKEIAAGNLEQAIANFSSPAESRALYGSINSQTIGSVIDKVYEALFDTAADAAGKQFYIDKFNAGEYSAGSIALRILEGAQNENALSVSSKLSAANMFVRGMDPELDGRELQATYAGDADVRAARAWLKKINHRHMVTQQQVMDFLSDPIADENDPLYRRGHQPTPPVQIQPEEGFKYAPDPLKVWESQPNYSYSYWVERNPLELSSYSIQAVTSGGVEPARYTISGSKWRKDVSGRLVFNPKLQKWVQSSGKLNVTQGPVGSSGAKTVLVHGDTGTLYYSMQIRDIAGDALSDWVGKGDGIPLPEAVQGKLFTDGAQARRWVVERPEPSFRISQSHWPFTNRHDQYPLYNCETVSRNCSSTPSSLQEAIASRAWFRNLSKMAVLRLGDGNQASLTITQENGEKVTHALGYQLHAATAKAPAHIRFSAPDQAAREAMEKELDEGENLALFEYGGDVVRGTYLPAASGVLDPYTYFNKQGMNDIMTQWSPRMPAVLE